MTNKPESIYTALVAAQSEFGKVTKGSTNPAFKSKYADLSDVASVVIPTLSAHGVCVVHYLVGDDLSVMRTEFVHAASETRVSCDIPLIVDRQNMQGMKSATTYAKRIGLESLSGVAPDDDDGNEAGKAPPPKQAPKPAQPTQEELDMARDAMEAADTVDQLRAIYADMPAPIKTALKGYATQLSEKLKAEQQAAPADSVTQDKIPY